MPQNDNDESPPAKSDNKNNNGTAADGISNYTPLQNGALSPVQHTTDTSPVSIMDNNQIPYESVFVDDGDDDLLCTTPFTSDHITRSRRGTATSEFDDFNNNNNNNTDMLTSPLLFLPEDHPDSPLLSRTTTPPEINGLNYLNGVTFVAHVFVSYGIGVWGLDGVLPSGWDISQRYETLVTPAFWAYKFMWAPILVCEAVFTICQFTPRFRGRPIIQEGTSVFFFYTCVVQTAWTLFFAFRFFVVSFVTVVLSLLSLLALVISQETTQEQLQSRQRPQQLTRSLLVNENDEEEDIENENDEEDHDRRGRQRRRRIHSESWRYTIEYWLFRFPFILHCGWMIVMTAVHFSLLIRDVTGHKATQLASDIFALAFLGSAACFSLYASRTKNPDFCIPIVILWAYMGIAWRLGHPSQALQEEFDLSTIHAVQQACWFLAGAVACMMCPRLLVWACHNYCTISVVEFQDG
eukprot:CAMPEP_0195284100 /NCGR_PEP_ID=MMETSP0707-20130614/2425_1 /TAXON_ID=33640 /ORGANISM="Asterionellopsis glacialis, Strain CCMP134" /LENGTH=464 /DNA_ID=CAMNT_0040343395 /DNA_START=58 /DNA_END=1452 /DNA_ORIENTATION=-